MKHTILFLAVSLCFGTMAKASNYEQDVKAIRKMAGKFKVTFQFSETFSPEKDYVYYDKKFDWGIELVKLIEESKGRFVFQHFLIVNDTMVIKHWRQEWLYENRNLLVYEKNSVWNNITLTAAQAKGTWTQKVFQVDDSPRYEGYGTWIHVDGRNFWEASADAPLPRREHTIRKDYNVTGRFSHIEIFEDGWVLEQDNKKILRDENNNDKLICMEKGIERFYSGDYNTQAAEDYWVKTEKYWEMVRKEWDGFLAKGKMEIKTKKGDNLLFMRLFELAETADVSSADKQLEVKSKIVEIINEHLEPKV